jgi:hypothetical protein
MRSKAPFATIGVALALFGCAGGQARPAGPAPVIVVGEEAVAPKGKYAIKGPAEGSDPQLARLEAIEDAKKYGILGVLGSGKGEGVLSSPFGSLDDDVGVIGGVLGGPVGVLGGGGSGFGSGGLGLSGIGGGGRGEGIGLGSIGTIGRGSGAGSAFGYGGLGVRGSGGRRAKVRFDSATVTGPLPAEAVQRVADDHQQDVEDCYLLEVARDAEPRGRVTLAITIDGQGSVTEVRVPETTLWTRDLPSCIAQAIGAWKFPPPASGGEVKVVLPVNL